MQPVYLLLVAFLILNYPAAEQRGITKELVC